MSIFSTESILLAFSDLSSGDVQKSSKRTIVPYEVGARSQCMHSSDAKPTQQLAVCKNLVSLSCSQDPSCVEVEDHREDQLEQEQQKWRMSMSTEKTPTSSIATRCPA